MHNSDCLTAIDLFRDCPAEQREALASRVAVYDVKRGQILVTQGDTSNSIFFVLSGRFIAHTGDGGKEGPLSEIGVGEPIGQVGFFANIPRSATVTAMRDSTVCELDRPTFDEFARDMPEFYATILATTARRLA